jgi:transposase
VRRHRLNRGGDRQLNRALHVMAIAQIRHATDGRAYYQRKLAERKTDKEALRALKRQLSNIVYRHLFDDYQNDKIRQLPPAA